MSFAKAARRRRERRIGREEAARNFRAGRKAHAAVSNNHRQQFIEDHGLREIFEKNRRR